ncbi:hypothetical protein DAEQUDRAFT_727758 [Daedalea quercina L-15889]|uniref:Uncharacterized protein n=1 Tax=Daedalea quercina L-15889 TaxID=1314783 RepID=A0A165PUH5_9APHY|nr:hypothetical protein DAEQUDRAFT_727758 [Daedalea quercina L-15889]
MQSRGLWLVLRSLVVCTPAALAHVQNLDFFIATPIYLFTRYPTAALSKSYR